MSSINGAGWMMFAITNANPDHYELWVHWVNMSEEDRKGWNDRADKFIRTMEEYERNR